MKTIAITGSTGFVGRRLLECNQDKFRQQPLYIRDTPIDNIDLSHIDVVVHLAGKAHQMEPVADNAYFAVNYELTRQLADKSKANGVRQFIYVSSTKVYGDEEQGPFNESSACNPTDAYGASKLKAEQYLQSIETALFKVAIIRPPLVYGPGVKGNMIRLLQLAGKNIVLPFAKIANARSMVFIDNLIALINIIIDKDAAGVFIAGDQSPVSTSELLSMIRKSLNKKNNLISAPMLIRYVVRKMRPALYLRLFGSFVIDSSSTNSKLGFTPPYPSAYGIKQMADWYKKLK